MQFNGTENTLTSPELRDTVNVAIALERPLLIKGEPGTGKTLLAEAIAESLDMELLTWHVKEYHQGSRRPLRLRYGAAAERRTF